MEKAFDGARIAALHWGVGHAGNRHVEIERSPGDPEQAEDHDMQPFAEETFGLESQPATADQRKDAHSVKDDEHPLFGKILEDLLPGKHVIKITEHVDHEIAKEHVP